MLPYYLPEHVAQLFPRIAVHIVIRLASVLIAYVVSKVRQRVLSYAQLFWPVLRSAVRAQLIKRCSVYLMIQAIVNHEKYPAPVDSRCKHMRVITH